MGSQSGMISFHHHPPRSVPRVCAVDHRTEQVLLRARSWVIPRRTFEPRLRLPVQAGVLRHPHDRAAHDMRFAPPQQATVARETRSPPAASAPAVPSPATTGLPRRDAPDRSRSDAGNSRAGADRRTRTTANSSNRRSSRARTGLPARRAALGDTTSTDSLGFPSRKPPSAKPDRDVTPHDHSSPQVPRLVPAHQTRGLSTSSRLCSPQLA